MPARSPDLAGAACRVGDPTGTGNSGLKRNNAFILSRVAKMEKDGRKRSWKDALLKTSLPLEHMIAEKLDRRGFEVCGEYSYVRTNAQGVSTEFSADLWAFSLLKKRKGGYWGT